MAFKLLDRVNVVVSGSPGTGDCTLGSPVASYQSFSAAGLSDGDTFPYLISEGTAWEFGVGTYHSSGPSFTRTTRTASSTGSAVSFTSAAVVAATLRAEDVLSASSMSSVLDAAFGSSRGNVLYRGSSGWAALAPGTAGLFLKTQGAGADPLWASAGAGGTSGVPILTPPTVAGVSAVTNLGGATLSDNTTGIKSMFVSPGASQINGEVYASMAAVPGGTFSAIVKVRRNARSPSGGWAGSGIAVRDNGAGKNIYLFVNGDNPYPVCYYILADTGTGGWASTTVTSYGSVGSEPFFYHIDYDGTNLNVGLSIDAVNWSPVASQAVSGWGTPTHVGPAWSGTYVSAAQGPYHSFEHFNVGALGSNGISYI